jgi:hypothetical protein
MPADPNIEGGYTWVLVPGSDTFVHQECGGLCEFLQVQPSRNKVYLNNIIMCSKCKWILA